MPNYRFYRIAAGNHIVAPGENRDFDGDPPALEHAEALVHGCTIDVWLGHRHVGHVTAQNKRETGVAPPGGAHPPAACGSHIPPYKPL
jgi:hypothetical protein